jgi:polyketide synthase PksJ
MSVTFNNASVDLSSLYSDPSANALALFFNFASGRCYHAADPLLDQLQVNEPQKSWTGHSWVTVNRFGFETASLGTNWAVDSFVKTLDDKSSVLDIGAGYGAISKAAIKSGAKVVSNDLALEHLLWLRGQVDVEEKTRLYLNTGRFPDLDIAPESLTHISAHRVFHFLSGSELELGLANCFKWLKPGGMFLGVAMSATHVRFRDAFYPEYEQRKDSGGRWPGEWLDVATHLPEQLHALPDKLHVFTPDKLADEVTKAGFTIAQSNFISLQQFGKSDEGRDGKEAVGFIAFKVPDPAASTRV